MRLNSSFILEKNKAICKEKKTLFQCLSVFFYHSTPTVATWGAQIRVGHQLIMPVSEPCKRLLMCWGGGSTYAYIYMRIANFYRKKTSGSGYQYLAWYNQSSVGTVGSRVLLLAVLPTVINGGDQAQSPLCPPPSSVPFSPSSPPRSPIAHRHPSLKEKAFFQSISQSVSHTGRS